LEDVELHLLDGHMIRNQEIASNSHTVDVVQTKTITKPKMIVDHRADNISEKINQLLKAKQCKFVNLLTIEI
jgi:hypothetical protein